MDVGALDQRLRAVENHVEAIRLSVAAEPGRCDLPADVGVTLSEEHERSLCARERRAVEARQMIFPGVAQGYVAWNVLIAAHLARIEGRKLATTDLMSLSFGTPSTALRWVDALIAAGLLAREQDPEDGRRRWVRLSEPGAQLMRKYAVEMLTRGGRSRRR